MPPKAAQHGPFIRGVFANTDPYSQPRGSVPRASNLIMTDRGALTDCDGSGIINWFSGAVQSTRGRFLADTLFAPTGVDPYYMALAQALDQPLGAPAHLTLSDAGAGGTLGAGAYFYEVTALDGVGGETTVSNEPTITIAANHKITLTWNVVPNAFAYNVYRTAAGGGSGTEVLLSGTKLPVSQPSPLTATVTFTDDGSFPPASSVFSITSASVSGSPGHPSNKVSLVLASGPISSQFFGKTGTISGNSAGYFNQSGTVTGTFFGFETLFTATTSTTNNITGTGGSLTMTVSPPVSDTTQQTVLFEMPRGTIPVSYSNSNIVAFFPATVGSLGQVPVGGSGGAGTTGAGISGRGSSTPSGGIAGLVGPVPQMPQFTNRLCLALGNGFAPQLFWDSTGTSVNPAPTGPIASVAVSNDQVTVTVSASVTISKTDPTKNGFMPVGTNVVLSGMSDSSYNGVFVVVAATAGAGGTFVVRNPTASGGASTGTFTVATTPIINTFIPAYPPWAASSSYAVGSITQPNAVPETYYFKAIQGGVSGGTEPTWTNAAVLGQEISDGTIIWQNQGPLQSAAPPPPGAGHLYVYSGELWAFNTSPSNTSSGLDGPCSLRSCDVNNPFSWNPINQAFLDKDDGTEGMGLATFTISAEGIPPEGSLIAYKNYSGFQIVGVFGSTNFSIQRIRSDMGCTAPRSIWFVPGYGIARYAHLGVALFDGVRDTVISEEMRPYLFPTNDSDNSDITVADANYIPFSQGSLTANPPMYVLAIPIGNSGGKLTRILNYDLVLKCWGGPIDLPFAISTLVQVRPTTSNPLTLFGGFLDGVLQRWQAGDVQWYTGDPLSVSSVLWSVTTPETFGNPADQKLHWRRQVIRGVTTGYSGTISVTPVVNGKSKAAQSYVVPANGDFEVFAGMRLEGLRFHSVISGSGHLEINRTDDQIYPKSVGVPSVIS